MPLTKCSHDDYAAADILQLQSLATVHATTSASITATGTTTIRRRWQQQQQHQFQQENNNNVFDVQQPQQHPSYPVRQQPCNDFLCCRAHCHHHYRHLHHHVEQQQQQLQHEQQHFQSHPVHNHQLSDYHHYQRRQSSVFPYSPSLNTPTAPPPSSYSSLSAKAGKVCSISRNTAAAFGGGGNLRLASSGRKLQLVIFILLNLLLRTCCGQLLINVQNQGGEVIQESITSNISEDLITLEFQKTDGTLITQIIDFRNEVRILKALVLGEEERGQNLYQVMCFVTKFTKGDFISSDAMAKLRQKNPSTIRTPEEDKGKDTFIMTSWVHLNRSQPISRHLMTVCGEAIDATYVRDVDLKAWSELPGSSISSLEAATEKFPDTLSSRCNEVSSLWAPCICTLETCIGWYPCGLKYCKGKATAGGDSSAAAAAASNYRCGIKTCRRCSQFSYYVRQKQQCLWDE